jgi:hypothetical protein
MAVITPYRLKGTVTFGSDLKFRNMKRSVLVLIVVAFALASCSQYTCPTYGKAPQAKPAKQSRI